MGRYCLEGKDPVRKVSGILNTQGLQSVNAYISLDYLFQLAVEMHKLGMDPAGSIASVEG